MAVTEKPAVTEKLDWFNQSSFKAGDEVRVELEATEKAPSDLALREAGDEEGEREKPDETRGVEEGSVVAGELEDSRERPGGIHAASAMYHRHGE